MRFVVIGGDQRIARLSRLLAADGHAVVVFALENAGVLPGTRAVSSIEEAARGAECVILPLPVAKQRGILNTPLSVSEYGIAEIFDALQPGTLICAGRVDRQTAELAAERGLELTDYFQREELAVKNAVATAEGAVGIIMQETATTLWQSRVLVIGYGRVGRLLAHRLQALGARVSVSARKFEDFAWIEALGCTALDTTALEGQLGGFDVVVNTVPAPVLGELRLLELKEGALCLDLASKPGGMDFAAASRLGIRAVWALSLPGEVAPVSAGAIIRDTIYNIMEERNGKT